MKFRYGEALNAAVLYRQWNGDIHPNRESLLRDPLTFDKIPSQVWTQLGSFTKLYFDDEPYG